MLEIDYCCELKGRIELERRKFTHHKQEVEDEDQILYHPFNAPHFGGILSILFRPTL